MAKKSGEGEKAEAPSHLDPAAARAALAKVTPRLLALMRNELIIARADVDKAVTFLLGILAHVSSPALRARFDRIDQGEFDSALLDDLPALTLALWQANINLRSTRAAASEIQVPAAIVEPAKALKERMLKLAAYYLGDHETAGPEIQDIIPGTGYLDLASDLSRLAQIYREHKQAIEKDTKLYRATDEAEAGKRAGEILQALGLGNLADAAAPPDAAGILTRVWTLVHRAYMLDIRPTGLWLERKEGGEGIYLSLYAAGRSAPGPRGKGGTGEPPAADGGKASG
jgi:hypothetical protein